MLREADSPSRLPRTTSRLGGCNKKDTMGRRTMSDEALARLRDLIRHAMDMHGHDVKEACAEISEIRDRRMNGYLIEIPSRSFEHYIARTDSDIRQPSRPTIRAIAIYAGRPGQPLDLEKILAGRYVVEGGGIWTKD
jgi:hypothetical protein